MVLKVKVSPGAAKNEIKEWNQDRLRIRVKAPPEKGKANKELRRFLAKALGISISQVTIRSGKTTRKKTIVISGIPKEKTICVPGVPE